MTPNQKTLANKKRTFKLLIMSLFTFINMQLFAQITSTASGGNWNANTTWIGGSIPTATDNVIIATGAIVDLTATGACLNLNVNGTLHFNTLNIAFVSTGITTVLSGGTINFTTTTNTTNIRSFNDIIVNTGGTWNSISLVTVTGNITNNGTFTTGTSGTFTLSGTNKTINGNNLTFENTTVSIAGSYTNNIINLNINANLSGTGSLTNAVNSSLNLLGSTNSITTLTATAVPNTVTYGRSGTQTVKGTTYYHLIIAGNNTKTAQAALIVNGDLNIGTSTVLHDNGFAITGTAGGTLNIIGELQLGAATATNLPNTFGIRNINLGSTIHFSTTNAGGQNIDHTVNYHSLKVSGNSTKNITGAIPLNGDLTISSGVLNFAAFNISVKGNVTNSGTQSGTGKIVLTNGTTEHTISGTGSYFNLEINDAVGASLGASINVNGSLAFTQGALRLLNRLLTINGNVEGNGQGFINNGTSNTGDVIIGGTIGGNAGTIYMDAAPNNTIRRFTLNRIGANAGVTFGNVVRIREELNLNNGAISHSGNLTIGVGTTTLTTTIVNGTLVTPPIFNAFTGEYRLQYGSAALLNVDLITGLQGEIPTTNSVARINLDNNTQKTITLSNDITVTGALTLTNGKLILNDKNLTATYTGTGATGNINSYIMTNSTGQFFRNIPAAPTGNFNFPIGTSSGYSLANITFVDNSNMSAGLIGARAVSGTPPNIDQTPNFLNKYWIFSDQRTGSSHTYRPTFTFSNSEITGTGSSLLLGRYDGSAWQVSQPSTTTETTITTPGSINLPLSGNNVVFSALSEPVITPIPNTVWDIIQESANHNTLELAINLAGLSSALEGDGPLTVFAPTDAAFSALPAGVLQSLLADPQGELSDALKYHVVGGVAALSNALTSGQVIQTLLTNQTVTVTINGSNILINNALVTIADIIAQNGVVHVIDAVLIPDTVNSINNLSLIELSVYPNPAREQLFMSCDACQILAYQLTGLDGKIVSQGILNQNYIISLENLNKGIYFVKLTTSKGAAVRKVIVN